MENIVLNAIKLQHAMKYTGERYMKSKIFFNPVV